ncbi:peptidase inhibitor family I36 protein [Streptomyces sp. AC495_CC817]|uniref:peptidase inhibitor family I36 protein n=1 Tax=Streptomyces sp. AC495_CC817 TaxID=2823900 RepID=UPI001C259780|nr:peptidase inhibitor family I36 protein [Streptomyces sp. AC495_CC817]
MTTTKKRLSGAGLGLASLLMVLFVLSGASPAQAAHEGLIKVCTQDYYKGSCTTRADHDKNLGNDYVSCGWCLNQTFSDSISSVDNDTDNWWKLFEDKEYRGYALCLRPRGYDNNLGNNTPMEDEISSMKKLGTTRPSGCDKVIG